ncbi:hypothetical protein BC830DRAFT_259760 [Chytriomyces sp. MP71]|nr:hypothetical protein BC830DRAFT_259760 [Chytriomyces sp. MP71]
MSAARRATIYTSGADREAPLKPHKEATPSQDPASSLSTLSGSNPFLTVDTRVLNARRSSLRYNAPSPREKSYHGTPQGLHNIDSRDSQYTIRGEEPSVPARDRLASIDEAALPPVRAEVGLKSQVSWNNIRANLAGMGDAGAGGPVNVPAPSKQKASESVGSLKRWHEMMVTAPEQLREDDATSSYLRGSEASSGEVDEDSEGDTVVTDDSSNGSTQNGEDESGSSRRSTASMDAEVVSNAQDLPEKAHWFANSSAKDTMMMEGDRFPSNGASSLKGRMSKTYAAGLPSLDENEENEFASNEQKSLEAKYLVKPFSKDAQQQHPQPQIVPQTAQTHGMGSWKLPPLLKKMVYGDPAKSKPSTAGTSAPRTVQQKINDVAIESKKPQNAGSALVPPSLAGKSYLPIPVTPSKPGSGAGSKEGPSKPTTTNQLMHAVKNLSLLGKARMASDPGLSKVSLTSLGKAKDELIIASSSKTLSVLNSSKNLAIGTIWDDEGLARQMEAEMGLTDEESYMAAKIRFDAKYKIQKQLGAGGHSTVRLATRAFDNKSAPSNGNRSDERV